MVRLRRLGTEYGRGGRCCLLVLADRFLCQVRCDAILSREPTFSARMGDNIEESEQTEVGAPSEPAEASVAEEESSAADPNELDEKDASERKRKNEDEQATAEEGAAEVESPPPRKKRSKSSGSAKKQKALEVVRDPNDKYPFARDRGIRIFSDREIDVQDAQLTRDYWRFWNDTAEELCSNRAYNDWGKRDLKLYIDAAWIIHKTYLQENVEKELAESLKEVQEKHGYEELPHKLKSQDEAVTTSLSKVGRDHEYTSDIATEALYQLHCMQLFSIATA